MRDPNRSTVTIREVAAHAGVSRMTVSRVINASTSVTPETRQRIEASIAATGYRPDPIARQLALGGKRKGAAAPPERRIGIVYPADGVAGLGELLAAGMDCADRAGVRVVPVSLGCCRDHCQLALALERAAADGVVLLPGSDAMLDEIAGIPAVAIDPVEARCGVTAICIDEAGTAQQLTEQLLAMGHRRIGFLAAAFGREREKAREHGLVQLLGRYGVPATVERSTARGLIAARGAALALLQGRHQVTAIVAANEELALACLAAAGELGIAVPADLTICSFGEAMGQAGREIVRATLPAMEMCRTALRLLDEQIDARAASQPAPGVTRVLMLRSFDLRGHAPRFHSALPVLTVPEQPRLRARSEPYPVAAGSR